MSQDVRRDIVEWSMDRPEWQRDALRRLFTTGEITAADIDALVSLCKASHGLSPARRAEPLTADHIRVEAPDTGSVSLIGVTHHRGVNALASEQTIRFGPAVTIVYGRNAAGKSGYTRILKKACRSRFTEDILSDVLGETTPRKAQATIAYRTGATATEFEWTPEALPSDALAAVSVFDAQCAPVYLKDKTDVAFRPFGLDIFDTLSSACADVRRVLETEQAAVMARPVGLPTLRDGTRPKELVDGLTALTKLDDVRRLATLSPSEERRLKELREQESDARARDPKGLARGLAQKAQRVELVRRHTRSLIDLLGNANLTAIATARETVTAARRAASVLREATLTADVLAGTGEAAWRTMWDAAEEFSKAAYPGSDFPVVAADARCPLCQQPIGADARSRLAHFSEYVRSSVEEDARRAEREYGRLLAQARDVAVQREDVDLAITELESDDRELAERVRNVLQQAARIQGEVKRSSQEGGVLPNEALPNVDDALGLTVGALHKRAAQLEGQTSGLKAEEVSELNDLESRVVLRDHFQAVEDEIERKKRLSAYRQCLDDTQTNAITRKSSDLTRRLVTDQLRQAFQDELGSLEFNELALEIQAAGGSRGALFHRLVFSTAPGVALLGVLSEGECRTLSLAAFLAELSTARAASAIIFDDPVSSLDDVWRERIARRLVAEAQRRQVIVFTHAIVFVKNLLDECIRQEVAVHKQYVRKDGHAGICSPDFPWFAMKVADRLGALRSRWQNAEKTFRTQGADAYEREAREIYALLRETWEQAVEEVLLYDVVTRYRHSVETKRARVLHDITVDDCDMLEAGMAECSRWMRGHDQPPADGTPFPQPAALRKALDDLDAWAKEIKSRRR